MLSHAFGADKIDHTVANYDPYDVQNTFFLRVLLWSFVSLQSSSSTDKTLSYSAPATQAKTIFENLKLCLIGQLSNSSKIHNKAIYSQDNNNNDNNNNNNNNSNKNDNNNNFLKRDFPSR